MEAEYQAWKLTREGIITGDYLRQRAMNGFLPSDYEAELDALLQAQGVK